jgi:catechol 2,3-dioxygenase-like lactoylglutathione lyase family enzyme
MLSPRIDHLGLSARDPQATAAFYRDVLGMTPVHGEGPGIHLRFGEAVLVIADRDPEETAPARAHGDHLALRVTGSADGVQAALAAAGVPFQRVRDRIYLRDPDGFVVELVG